jgi:phosphohistidine swiveling domain-containing protein
MVDVGKLYMTQISMTEWFDRMHHTQTAALRTEDNTKRDRLKVIHSLTGMPYDEPREFEATDLANNTPSLRAYVAEHGEDAIGIQVLPKDTSLSKQRLRGKTVRESIEWFHTLGLDATQYKINFVPHAEVHEFSTIFVVNDHGIFGEIIKGGHFQLTQGFYDKHKPVTFSYNFSEWTIADPAPEYRAELEGIIKWLRITDTTKQAALKQALDASFAHDYLKGYFETITNGDGIGLWFVDYNRILGKMFSDAQAAAPSGNALLRGQPASKGVATGKVKIILEKDVATATITDGDVLVCDITTPDYMPLMQKAAAVVTDRGGILSHAAIVCRELGKPCVAATGNATSVLKNGQKITVNADSGAVILS